MQIRKITALSLWATLSLAIYAVESMIPPLVPIPGIKLGLANIITLLVMVTFSRRYAFLVLLVRILLSCLLFGQVMSLLYSLAGGLFCFLVVSIFVGLLNNRHLYFTSAFGAIAHNIGQLWIAYLLTKVDAVFHFLPFLILSGILTGLFTGLCAHFALAKLIPATTHLPFFQRWDDDN